jgi:hypothetical protein
MVRLSNATVVPFKMLSWASKSSALAVSGQPSRRRAGLPAFEEPGANGRRWIGRQSAISKPAPPFAVPPREIKD